MKKTVIYNGEKIKVNFNKIIVEHNTIQEEKICLKRRIYLQPRIWEGVYNFVINQNEYKVEVKIIKAEKTSYKFIFEGVVFTKDNDKKIIEHIVEKYGI